MLRSRFTRVARLAAAAAVTAVVGAAWLPTVARAQQIPARAMVLIDTSASMLEHFNSFVGCGGDGDAASRYRDFHYTTYQPWYPGTDGWNSRLYAAKQAFTAVINASAGIDFGLMRYAPDTSCPDAVKNCCQFSAPKCSNYPSNSAFYYSDAYITWYGGCGPVSNRSGQATDGGQILVVPGQASGNETALGWVDGVEWFEDRGDGWPKDPELRAAGVTPLAGAARSALNRWYTPIYNVSKAGLATYNPNDPNFDPQLDCRPYAFVVMSDGGDDCDVAPSDPVAAPPSVTQALYAKNPANPAKTYVIGLSITDPTEKSVLEAMAASGGTGNARFASSQTDIEVAFAQIAAASIKYETCNGKDDNCNGLVDEGFDVGAACSVGVGACLRDGVKKCSVVDPSTTSCCANDGAATCALLAPGAPTAEICNGIDDDCNGLIDDGGVCQKCTPTVEVCDGKDNDCDGVIDDHLVDEGLACGPALGACTPGTTDCQPDVGRPFPDGTDHLVCVNARGPTPEVCNGIDDDCDGVVDGLIQACYDGAPGTEGVGPCTGGQQLCNAAPGSGVASWGTCFGEVLPRPEVCNGADDDCDGVVDDLPGAGTACCPSGRCGIGACAPGMLACSGGGLACEMGTSPSPEICNGIDDDCNGIVDDVPNLGKPCQPPGGCAGALACDVPNMQIVCAPVGVPMPELCNGKDDNCNGLVDEEPEVDSDPAIGVACGPGLGKPSPCIPGKTVCKNGAPTCVGGVPPRAEVCNCVDDDCDGVIDDAATCPGGSACHDCACDEPCTGGEFPCPGGYDCDQENFCVPVQTCDPACDPGSICVAGVCVDQCAGVTCPTTYRCFQGTCVGNSCVELDDCAPCERCDTVNRACVHDQCCNVTCDAGKVCDPTNGRCLGSCASVTCSAGQACVDGDCAAPPCAGAPCPLGQACDPQSNACVTDACGGTTCPAGLVCVGGACVEDTCPLIDCPSGTRCATNRVDGSHTCATVATTKPMGTKVVGGCACAIGGRVGDLDGERDARDRSDEPSGPGSTVAALVVLGLLASRRRRA